MGCRTGRYRNVATAGWCGWRRVRAVSLRAIAFDVGAFELDRVEQAARSGENLRDLGIHQMAWLPRFGRLAVRFAGDASGVGASALWPRWYQGRRIRI